MNEDDEGAYISYPQLHQDFVRYMTKILPFECCTSLGHVILLIHTFVLRS